MGVELSLTEGFYESDSLPLSAQECINLYPNIPQTNGALSTGALFGSEGVEQVATKSSTSTKILGGVYFDDGTLQECVLLGDTRRFQLKRTEGDDSDTFDLEEKGTVSGVTGPILVPGVGARLSIALGNSHVAWNFLNPDGSIVPAFAASNSATTTAITDVDFTTTNGVPQAIAHLDGYFVATTSTAKIKISNLNDPATWDALDFTSAEASPDGTVAPFVFDNQLYIFGEQSYEIFTNIGGAAFPFQRIPGSARDVGLIGQQAITKTNSRIYFVGAGPEERVGVFAATASGYERVSTKAIDILLQGEHFPDLQNAKAFSYGVSGNQFIAISLSDNTIVYDENTGRWHRRESYIGNESLPWRAESTFTAWGELFVGDSLSPSVGRMRRDVFTDFGGEIRREFIGPALTVDGNPFSLSMVELTLESGVGNATDTDPVIEMSISMDGKTWGVWRPRKMGKVGKYGQRCIWRRNPQIPRFCYLRFRTTAAVDVKLLKLMCEVGA